MRSDEEPQGTEDRCEGRDRILVALTLRNVNRVTLLQHRVLREVSALVDVIEVDRLGLRLAVVPDALERDVIEVRGRVRTVPCPRDRCDETVAFVQR